MMNGSTQKRRRDGAYRKGFANGLQAAAEGATGHASLATAMAAVEAAIPDAFWQLARGRITPTEPLFGAFLFDGETPVGAGEGPDAATALLAALETAQSGTWSPPQEDETTIEHQVIQRIAQVASAVGFQAGEPAMEFAGQIVSVLAINPEMVGRFLREGHALFLDGSLNVENGCLPYRAQNGRIVSPSELRQKMGLAQ